VEDAGLDHSARPDALLTAPAAVNPAVPDPAKARNCRQDDLFHSCPVQRAGAMLLHQPRSSRLKMNKLRIFGTAAVMALLIPLVSADPGFAGGRGGGGGFRGGGGHFGGGGVRIGGGGGGFRGGIAPGGGARVGGGTVVGRSGGTRGGSWRGGAVLGGLAAGALIGGAAAYPYSYDNGYYDGSYYGTPGYYSPPPAEAPYSEEAPEGYDGASNADAAEYCAQRFQSYDPASGTYLGYDGIRRPCP